MRNLSIASFIKCEVATYIYQHFASLPLHAMSVLVTACRTQCITAAAGIERTRVTAGGTRTCTLLVLPRTGVWYGGWSMYRVTTNRRWVA